MDGAWRATVHGVAQSWTGLRTTCYCIPNNTERWDVLGASSVPGITLRGLQTFSALKAPNR